MKYRSQLPYLTGRPTLTDGGLETVLIFQQGVELPLFVAFPLLDRTGGTEMLRDYYRPYASIARNAGMPLILESPTWRANPDWGGQLGYDQSGLDRINQQSIELMQSVQEEHESPDAPMILSGCVGPRGDGYKAAGAMTSKEAQNYHSLQICSLANAGADQISALTLNYVAEAIGIIRAAQNAEIPAIISFTVETDGKLPDGTSIGEAIRRCDAETDAYATRYMINCAHPSHFSEQLENGEGWPSRLGGIRANASRLSHEELDEAEELDEGNPEELAEELAALQEKMPQLSILGGCCGTDHRHIAAIAAQLTPQAQLA